MTSTPLFLVVRLSSLGDIILTTPLLASLKKHSPGARVCFLLKERYAQVLRGHPAVDEILTFESLGFSGWIREIQRRRFDAYLDLHGTFRSRLWGALSGIPRRTRYDKRAWARRKLVWFKERSPRLDSSVRERYMECLKPLGIPPAVRETSLAAPSESPWGGELAKGPFLTVAPGAQHATKRWPAERFAEASDALARRLSAGIVVVGAPSDGEAAADFLKHARGPVLSLAGKTSVSDMMYVISRSKLLLTNDSGAMHMGVAFKVPTVAVFGPTVREFGFFPQPGEARVLEREGLYCRPCALHGSDDCPEGHFRCMRETSVEEVIQTAMKAVPS